MAEPARWPRHPIRRLQLQLHHPDPREGAASPPNHL